MAINREMVLKGKIEAIAGYSGEKERCPECGRETDDGFCAVHAEVDTKKDFSLTVKLDGRRVKLNDSHFEKITGFSTKDIEALPENEKISVIKEKLNDTKLRATGSNGENRFYPDSIDVIKD